jgi:uncharacterized protein
MGRILFFLLLGVALYVGFRIWRTGQRHGSGSARAGAGEVSEPMTRCAHCGLNVPRSEAIGDAGRWYCSEAHRRLGHDRR